MGPERRAVVAEEPNEGGDDFGRLEEVAGEVGGRAIAGRDREAGQR